MKAMQHRIKRYKTYSRPIHSASFLSSPQAREFENEETDQMIVMEIVEPAQAK